MRAGECVGGCLTQDPGDGVEGGSSTSVCARNLGAWHSSQGHRGGQVWARRGPATPGGNSVRAKGRAGVGTAWTRPALPQTTWCAKRSASSPCSPSTASARPPPPSSPCWCTPPVASECPQPGQGLEGRRGAGVAAGAAERLWAPAGRARSPRSSGSARTDAAPATRSTTSAWATASSSGSTRARASPTPPSTPTRSKRAPGEGGASRGPAWGWHGTCAHQVWGVPHRPQA